MLPMVALGMIGIGSQALFSGVSLLIMVGVGLDTVKQIESQLQQHHYAGFLRQLAKPAGPAISAGPARAAGPGGEFAGTPGGSAALTLS